MNLEKNDPERLATLLRLQRHCIDSFFNYVVSIELPPSYGDTLADKPRLYQRHRRQLWDQLSEEEVRESIAHYYALAASTLLASGACSALPACTTTLLL